MDNKVIIQVRGGIADVVHLPPDVELLIRDYDIDGTDPDRLDLDDDGNLCVVSEYVGVEREDG
jgi:hypothetical protein